MKNDSIFYQDVSLDDYEPLREASNAALNRIIRSMDNFSYIIISSDKHELSKEENLKRFSDFTKMAKGESFRYIPVKGGYLADGNIPVLKNALIIFNTELNRKPRSAEDLYNFGLRLCNYTAIPQDEHGDALIDIETCGQESFLFKEQHSAPAYYDNTGRQIKKFSNNLSLNDNLEHFFSTIIKDTKRFSFKEVFIPRYPMSNSGFIVRYLQGELI